jgi:hypothetical protein
MTMKIKKFIQYYPILILIIVLCGLPSQAFAEQLSKARVYYMPPDGHIWVTYFLSESCLSGESETSCMDRISKNNSMEGMPYDDMFLNELPDRTFRNKWRGEKGKGIWIDHSLITRNDKIKEFNEEIDKELDKNKPDMTKVSKLGRVLKKVQDINHPVLTAEDLTNLELKKKSLLASVIDSVTGLFSDVLTDVKNGILALQSLVTKKIQVGTSQMPAGITIYDEDTGAAFCIKMKAGQIVSAAGECGSTSSPQSGSPPPAETPVQDTEPPTITLTGNNPATLELGSTYGDLGATVTDNVNNNLGYKVSVDDGPEIYPNEIQIDTSVAGEHTIVFTAVDQAGNVGTATRAVNVVDSTVPSAPEPLPAEAPSEVEAGVPEPPSEPTPEEPPAESLPAP